MHIALKFAYYGIKFQGYARQPKLKTVEGEIIDLLIQNNIIKDDKQSKFRSASRTDKGASALGNVIAFNTALTKNKVFKKLKNNNKDILFYGIKKVEQDFYPRYAKLRIYRYYLKKQDFDIKKGDKFRWLIDKQKNNINLDLIKEYGNNKKKESI